MADNTSVTDAVDNMLLNILRDLDDEGMDVTLFVQGAVLTGRAVRRGTFYRKAFFETMDNLADDWDETRANCERIDAEDAYAAGLVGRERDSLSPDDQFISDEHVRHINLLDAHYVTGAVVSPVQPLSIRVRTDSVNAWTLARIIPRQGPAFAQ